MDLHRTPVIFQSYDARAGSNFSNISLEEELHVRPTPMNYPSSEDPDYYLKSRSFTPTSRYNWMPNVSGPLTTKKKCLANITNMPNLIGSKNKDRSVSPTNYTEKSVERLRTAETDRYPSFQEYDLLEKSADFGSNLKTEERDRDVSTPKIKSTSFIGFSTSKRDTLTTAKKPRNPDFEAQVYRSQSNPKFRSNKGGSSPKKSRRLMIDVHGKEHEVSSSNVKTPITEKAKRVVEDRKVLAEQFKHQGAQRYENKVMRKEMEKQMQLLQNRIKRLQIEQENMKKQLQKTEKITKKTIESKQRHLDNLVKAENDKFEKLRTEQRAREEIYSEKKEQISNLKNSLALARLKKATTAQDVRVNALENEEKIILKKKAEAEKKIEMAKKTAELEKRLKETKIKKTLEVKEKVVYTTINVVDEEKKKANQIQEKIKEMAKLEEALIDQIKTTQQIKETMEDRMKKISATKVSAHKPLDFINE